MQKHITRRYLLTAQDVRQAIYLYLKVHNDQPMPDELKDANIVFDDTCGASVSFDETAVV